MYTKEQMLACWMRSAYKSKAPNEIIDRDYEKSCFENWLKHIPPQ